MSAASTEKLEIYRSWTKSFFGWDTSDGWRWRYRARNGRILAQGSESYRDRSEAIRRALQVLGLHEDEASARRWYRSALVYAYWDRNHGLELVDRGGVAPWWR